MITSIKDFDTINSNTFRKVMDNLGWAMVYEDVPGGDKVFADLRVEHREDPAVGKVVPTMVVSPRNKSHEMFETSKIIESDMSSDDMIDEFRELAVLAMFREFCSRDMCKNSLDVESLLPPFAREVLNNTVCSRHLREVFGFISD